MKQGHGENFRWTEGARNWTFKGFYLSYSRATSAANSRVGKEDTDTNHNFIFHVKCQFFGVKGFLWFPLFAPTRGDRKWWVEGGTWDKRSDQKIVNTVLFIPDSWTLSTYRVTIKERYNVGLNCDPNWSLDKFLSPLAAYQMCSIW